MAKIDESKFIDTNRIRSYKAIFNFINTCRNKGKTWGFAKVAFCQFKKHGKTTLWIRRFSDEIEKTKGKIFKKKLKKELGLNSKNFKWVGSTAYYKRKNEFEPFLFLCTLSRAKSVRSGDEGATEFVIFDEYTTTPAKYALYRGNEAEDFIDMVYSMKREHAVTAFLLGNKESAINPYFRYFGIPAMPTTFEGIRTYNDGTILCYYSNTIPDEIAKTDFNKRFMTAIKNTPYAKYLSEGAIKGTSNRIEKKPRGAKFLCQFDFIGGFSLFQSKNKIYVVAGVDKTKLVYVETPKTYAKQLVIAPCDKVLFKELLEAYKYGLFYFDTPAAEELFLPLKRIFAIK